MYLLLVPANFSPVFRRPRGKNWKRRERARRMGEAAFPPLSPLPPPSTTMTTTGLYSRKNAENRRAFFLWQSFLGRFFPSFLRSGRLSQFSGKISARVELNSELQNPRNVKSRMWSEIRLSFGSRFQRFSILMQIRSSQS